MIVPAKEATAEIEVKKSRFIANAFYCDSFDVLKKKIADTRAANPGARHVVHAAVIGTQFSFSDDKEPKNTAGRPAFEVLKGSGIGNIGVTITRYFGGTLLGTGGLVKAYGDSMKTVLAVLETEELIAKSKALVKTDYSFYKTIKMVSQEFACEILSEDFAEEVSVTLLVPSADKEGFEKRIGEISQGSVGVLWC